MRCTRCGTPGTPYTYKGREFSGLCAAEGEQLCRKCRDGYLADRQAGYNQAPVTVWNAAGRFSDYSSRKIR